MKILTDFDRTMVRLYESARPLYVLKEKIVRHYQATGVPESITAATDDDGYHAWHALHRWVAANLHGETGSAVNDVAEKIVTGYELERAADISLLPGVRDAILGLGGPVILGIVSSNSHEVIEMVLERDGLLSRIAYIQGRPSNPFDPDQLKPSPFLLQRASTAMDCPPGTWYIGDDSIDIEAAHAAGMKAAGVATGRLSLSDLSGFGADLVADSFGTALRRLTTDGTD
jgi:phosphoglycolate phosphatase-like HAD superfamily hydrolase